MFRPACALELDDHQHKRLKFLTASGQTPQKVALRARIVLLASEGRPNHAIAQTLQVSHPTVLLWRERFAKKGVPGLLPGRAADWTQEGCHRRADSGGG